MADEYTNKEQRQMPDPSSMTTQVIWREIAALKELFETRLTGLEKSITVAHDDLVRVPTDVQKQVGNLKELHEIKIRSIENDIALVRNVLETRFDGMDKAINLLQDAADKFPDRIDEKIGSLSAVHEEKFRSIQVQFAERDVRTEQTSRDSKVAVDAALQAAKEAVAEQNRSSALSITKSESATGKQIDQLVALIQSNTKGVDDKFDDIKERLTRLEGRGEGTAVAVTTRQASGGYMAAIAGVLIALIALLFAFFRR